MFVTLKDGSKMEVESGLTALEITKRISEGLARAALVCRVDGELRSMNEVIVAIVPSKCSLLPTRKARRLTVTPARTFSLRRSRTYIPPSNWA